MRLPALDLMPANHIHQRDHRRNIGKAIKKWDVKKPQPSDPLLTEKISQTRKKIKHDLADGKS